MNPTRGLIFACALLLLGAAYVINGALTLGSPTGTTDLTLRLQERAYLLRGVDPYDVSARQLRSGPTPLEAVRIASQGLASEPSIDPSGYPPWGLAAAFLLLPPGTGRAAHLAFVLVDFLALGLILWQAYETGRRWGAWAGLLLAAAAMAMFGNASTMRLGQYGLLLNAFLILSLRFWISQQGGPLGLCLAVAAIKPNYTIFHLILLPVCRQWRALLIVAAVCLLASIVPWALTGVDPVELLAQMMRQSAEVTGLDTSLLRIARQYASYGSSTLGLGLAGLALTLWLGWRHRRGSVLLLFSIAAVSGRIFLYHRQYDNLMLWFPLLALGHVALESRKAEAWWVFALFGATLWSPIPYRAYSPGLIAVLTLVWLAGLAYACRHAGLLLELEESGEGPGRSPGKTSGT